MILGHVDYMGVRGFAIPNPGFTNVVNMMPRVSVDEAVYGNEWTENGSWRML